MLYLITIVVGIFNEAFVKGRVVVPLDRSGGCALCIVIGPARLESIRAAIKQKRSMPVEQMRYPLRTYRQPIICPTERHTQI